MDYRKTSPVLFRHTMDLFLPVEAVLIGERPSGLSMTRLTNIAPMTWDAQRMNYRVKHPS
jgi:hypothetical protein